MAITNIRLGFVRCNSLPETLEEGKLYFNKADHQIHLKVGEEVIAYGGALTDATLVNNVLTITKADGTNVVLDFTDVASASQVMNAFKEIDERLDAASVPYTGSNAISVSDHAISLVIDPTDKVLSQSGTGLLSNLSLAFDSATATIKLMGKDADTPISTIDLPLEQILKSATLGKDGHLKLVFNTTAGDQEVDVDLSSLIDNYTGGNGINVASGTISIKIDEASESYLTVSESGLKLSGLTDALEGKLDSTVTINGKSFSDGALTLDATEIKTKAAVGGIVAGTSVEAALTDLNTRISSVESGGVTNVVAGNGIEIDATSVNSPKVSVKADPKDDNTLQVSETGAYVPAMVWEEF